MARTASTQLAASLFIKGDPTTGRRITSISELSKITGITRTHLQQVKATDDWQGQADKLAQDSTIGFAVHSEAMEKVVELRDVLRQKLDDQLEAVKAMDVGDDGFPASYSLLERLMDRWGKLSGTEAFLAAQKVYQAEMAKLRAKVEIEDRLRELGEDDGKEDDAFAGLTVCV